MDGGRQARPDLSDTTINELRAAMDAITTGVPGFRRRRVQDRAITAIARTLEPKGEVPRVLALEAPTGTGKSIGYLVPGIVAAKRHEKTLMVATATVALQRQLQQDLDALAKSMPEKLRYRVLKGRSRYVCDRSLASLVGEDPDQMALVLPGEPPAKHWPFRPTAAERKTATAMMEARRAGTWDGDLDGWRGDLSQRLRPLVTTTTQSCAGMACPFVKQCAFFRARAGWAEADILLVNHALLLADQRQGGGAILPKLKNVILVVDEAHHLPDAAIEAAGCHGPIEGHAKRLKEAWSACAKASALHGRTHAHTAVDAIANAQDSVVSSLDKLRDVVLAAAGASRNGRVFGASETWRLSPSVLDGILDDLAAGAKSARWFETQIRREREKLTQAAGLGIPAGVVTKVVSELGAHEHHVADLADLLELLSDADARRDVPLALWLTRDRTGRFELHACPVDAAGWLYGRVWTQAFGSIATSATLRAMGSWAHFLERSGLGRIKGLTTIALPSPFDLERAAVLRVPAMVTEPSPSSEDAYIDESLLDLATSVDTSEGTLILCASESLMRKLVDRSPPSWRDLLLVQGDRSVGDLLATHRERIEGGRGSILVGMATLAEGVNLPGRLCSHVVVLKIPFGHPDDPVSAARADWLQSRGVSAFAGMVLPEAHRRLTQACGRLIRLMTDTGRITLLDNRLLTKAYGRKMLDTLPPYRRDIGKAIVSGGRAA